MQNDSQTRIVLSGGLSGGHVFPLAVVSRALRERSEDPVFLRYIGSKGAFETAAMEGEGIGSRHIVSGKARRYFSFRTLFDPFKVVIGFVQSLWHLLVFMPDVIFAKGGAVSVPVCLAGFLYRIPIVIHDSDAVPGAANRFLARFSTRIAVAYPSAMRFFPPEKTALVGNPVRPVLLSGDSARADETHGLRAGRPLVLVLGGSLGARSLNRAFVRTLPGLLRTAEVLHQTGTGNFADTTALAAELGIKAGREGYHPVPFLSGPELADALARADIVVSRAGAGTIAELAALGKAAILVPLPTAANDEQRMNAYEVAGQGGAIVLEEKNLGEHLLLSKMTEVLGDRTLRESMSQRIRVFHNPEAANMIADGILELIERDR